MIKRLFKIGFVAAVMVICTALYLDYYVKNVEPDHKFANLDNKVLAHAGYFKDLKNGPNSIESFNLAKEKGAIGTELDVIYDIETQKFVVSHDFPYKEHNGRLLYLDSVFATYGNQFVYWLDFKNLKNLKSDETEKSCENLIELINEKGINKDHVLIESTELSMLAHFTSKGFYTSWWVLPEKSRYRSILRNYKYKLYYRLGKFSSLSMPYKYYPRIEESMKNIPINLWTVNDEEKFKEFYENDKVKILLTDMNWYD
tara:strand:+ start:49816 stop:50586 length:771 start_codon:yes stop_codon:yes gene_type:complete